MNTKHSEAAEWGSFAIVTYIPEPLGSFLNAVRRTLPGDGNPQAHITILPPRPLAGPVDVVSREAQSTLSRFRPFAVDLAGVKVFPETNILYLDISLGGERLHELHDALNTGLLTHDETFDFLPHLTISGPIPLERLAEVRNGAKRTWAKREAEANFEISEVVALWQPLHGSPDDWSRVWSQRLGDSGQSARAGALR